MYAPETLHQSGWSTYPAVVTPVAIAPDAARFDPVARYQLNSWDRELISGSPNTAAIWMLAALPVVAIALYLAWVANLVSFEVAVSLGILLVVASIALPIWDRIRLTERNLDGPSLLWLLLAAPVSYLIVRSVKLARDGVAADAPGIMFFITGAALVATVLVTA